MLNVKSTTKAELVVLQPCAIHTTGNVKWEVVEKIQMDQTSPLSLQESRVSCRFPVFHSVLYQWSLYTYLAWDPSIFLGSFPLYLKFSIVVTAISLCMSCWGDLGIVHSSWRCWRTSITLLHSYLRLCSPFIIDFIFPSTGLIFLNLFPWTLQKTNISSLCSQWKISSVENTDFLHHI